MLEAEGYEQVAYMATCLHIVVVMAYVAPFTPEHFSATSAMAQQYMAVLTLSVHFGPDSCFYSQLSILSSPIISRNQGPMSGADLPLVHLLHLLLDSLTHSSVTKEVDIDALGQLLLGRSSLKSRTGKELSGMLLWDSTVSVW